MPTAHDTHRIQLFQRWFNWIGRDLDEAARRTGIARRTLERMAAGQRPPPVRLLDSLATDAADRGNPALAGALAGAAAIAGGRHA